MDKIRVILPALLLLAVGIMNRVAVAQTNLSAWELGGFGMFSTTDSPGQRVVRLTAQTDSGATVVLLPGGEFAEAIDKLQVLPSDGRSTSLAVALRRDLWLVKDAEAEPQVDGSTLTHVEVVVGRIVFDEDTSEMVFNTIAQGVAP